MYQSYMLWAIDLKEYCYIQCYFAAVNNNCDLNVHFIFIGMNWQTQQTVGHEHPSRPTVI
jgi:hypothetical protein